METGYCCYSLGTQVWQWRKALKRVLNLGGGIHLPFCRSLWMVMGAAWLDSAEWDIPIRDTFSRAEHYSGCEPTVHFHHSPIFSIPPMCLQVRNFPLLFWVDNSHDNLCVHLPTWNEGNSHRRDDTDVAKALVLEENCTGISRSLMRALQHKATGWSRDEHWKAILESVRGYRVNNWPSLKGKTKHLVETGSWG